jgi:hypothetical protein
MAMESKTKVGIPASLRAPPEHATRVADVSAEEKIEVSVYLKPVPGAPPPAPIAPTPDGRAAMLARHVVEHQDGIRLVSEFAAEAGLTVTEVNAARRLLKLKGPASKMQAAFGAIMAVYDDGNQKFRARTGTLQMPQDVADVVESVLGFDNRPAAIPHFVQFEGPIHGGPIIGGPVIGPLNPAVITGHRPNAVGAIYGFPTGVTGAGQCIGIVELGGGFKASDNTAAFAAMGLPVPTIVAVSVDGGQNSPGNAADGEVALDIQVAGGVAPGSRIAVYFAPNTFQGFVDAVSSAAHDNVNKPSVISISWGTAEQNWSVQSQATMNTVLHDAGNLGISVFVASGDHLASDGIGGGKAHVDFPASSPYAIGCGGTTLDTSGNSINNEVVWNDGNTGWGTGGGISDFFAVPAFQAAANLPVSVNDGQHRRGVPDLAGDASQASGYLVVLNGVTAQIGGTSAVAPLWAGLAALINQAAPHRMGFFLPTLYQHPKMLRQITSGNNKVFGTNLGYTATAGAVWNGCTGLGVPVGGALFRAFVDNTFGAPLEEPALAVMGGKLYVAWKGIPGDEGIWWTTTTNGTTWAAQQHVANVGTSAGPALATLNNTLVMAWKGSTGDQRIWWSTFNGASWAPQQVVPNVSTSIGPKLAVFNGKVYMIWKGSEGDQTIWWSSLTGTTWAPQQKIANVATAFGPALAVFNGRLYAAWRGMVGDERLWFSNFNGAAWSAQQQIPGDASSVGPTLAVYGNSLYASWKGMLNDERLWYSHFNGASWVAQQQIPGVASSVGAGIATFINNLYAVWKGQDNDTRLWFSRFNGATWTAQQVIPGVGSGPDVA